LYVFVLIVLIGNINFDITNYFIIYIFQYQRKKQMSKWLKLSKKSIMF